MVDLVAGRAGVEVVGLAAIAVAGDVLAIVVMIGVVRVVMTAVRVVRAATIVVGRVGSGSRVARAVMTVVVHDAMGNVMTAVRDSVMIAMMRQSLWRSSVARRCSRVRARASTAKTNRLPIAKIGMSASSMRARFVASAFGVTNPSARSAGRGGIEVARRSQHRLHLRIPWRGKYGKPLAIGGTTT